MGSFRRSCGARLWSFHKSSSDRRPVFVFVRLVRTKPIIHWGLVGPPTTPSHTKSDTIFRERHDLWLQGGDQKKGGGDRDGDAREKKKKETILDLSKYLDKPIRVKFSGGREGETSFIQPATLNDASGVLLRVTKNLKNSVVGFHVMHRVHGQPLYESAPQL